MQRIRGSAEVAGRRMIAFGDLASTSSGAGCGCTITVLSAHGKEGLTLKDTVLTGSSEVLPGVAQRQVFQHIVLQRLGFC